MNKIFLSLTLGLGLVSTAGLASAQTDFFGAGEGQTVVSVPCNAAQAVGGVGNLMGCLRIVDEGSPLTQIPFAERPTADTGLPAQPPRPAPTPFPNFGSIAHFGVSFDDTFTAPTPPAAPRFTNFPAFAGGGVGTFPTFNFGSFRD